MVSIGVELFPRRITGVAADGTTFPPKGVLGGQPATSTRSQKILADGRLVDLPAFNAELCAAGEKMSFLASGGGGYGPPSGGSPERVLRTVNRGWLTPAKAAKVYGVKVRFDDSPAQYELAIGYDGAGVANAR
jgi:N-methylhydantoinase B